MVCQPFCFVSVLTTKLADPNHRRRVEKEAESRYGEIQSDESTKTACREPGVALCFATTVDCSLNFDSPGVVGACKNYSNGNAPIAVTEVRSLTTRQKKVTAKEDECAITEFPENMVVQRKKVRNEAEGCNNAEPRKRLSG